MKRTPTRCARVTGRMSRHSQVDHVTIVVAVVDRDFERAALGALALGARCPIDLAGCEGRQPSPVGSGKRRDPDRDCDQRHKACVRQHASDRMLWSRPERLGLPRLTARGIPPRRPRPERRQPTRSNRQRACYRSSRQNNVGTGAEFRPVRLIDASPAGSSAGARRRLAVGGGVGVVADAVGSVDGDLAAVAEGQRPAAFVDEVVATLAVSSRSAADHRPLLGRRGDGRSAAPHPLRTRRQGFGTRRTSPPRAAGLCARHPGVGGGLRVAGAGAWPRCRPPFGGRCAREVDERCVALAAAAARSPRSGTR